MRKLSIVALIFSLLLSCAHSIEDDDFEVTPQREYFDSIFQPLVSEKRNAGIVVGIIKNDEKKVFGYGKTDLDDGSTPNGKTIFSIGSITKVFTNLLLAVAVEERKVSWNDPFKDRINSSFKIPSYPSREVTFLDLSTHTSGLPRMPGNLELKGLNPYKDYTVENLQSFLNEFVIENEPGEKYNYSNLGTGILGHGLSLIYNTSYEKLLRKKIFRKMGLKDTSITLKKQQNLRHATGYYREKNGKLTEVPYWQFDVLAPCGAIKSTADDLLSFLYQNLNQTKSKRLNHAITSLREHHHDTKTPPLKITKGWHLYDLNNKVKIYWHNGGTYGFKSIIAFNMEKKVAVVVLSNTFETNSEIDNAGFKVLKYLMQN